MVNKVLIFFSAMLFCSCKATDNSMHPRDYISFIEAEENNYRVVQEAGNYSYTFQYKPVEYIALKELDAAGKVDSAAYQKRIKSLKNTVWFNIYVESANSNINPIKNNISGMDEYNQRVAYFFNDARNNFRLYYGKDLMPQAGYHFENNYSLTPNDVMVVGFKIPDAQPMTDMTLEYDDMLFKNEMLKVKITKTQLSDIPTLIF